MTYEADRSALLAVDGARLKVLTEFVMKLAHAEEYDTYTGAMLRTMAQEAMEQSIAAGRDAFYKGAMG